MKRLMLTGALLALASPACATEKEQQQPSLVAMVDNDSFINGIDRHYTNGLYFSWTGAPETRDGDFTHFLKGVMLPGGTDAQWREGYFFGQSMFTPENLFAKVPPANDRPYAGWLYGGARLYRDSGDTLDRVEATVGVVGPSSLASDLHHAWHAAGIFGGIHPNGWHYQLRGEPGLILTEQRIWRVNLSDGPLEIEALPQANISLGNIYDYAGAGGMLRVGQGLASDWGPPRIAPALQGSDFQSPHDLAWYVFAGFEGRAVAHNIFLDGSSFEASRSVTRESLVGDFTTGAALLLPGARLMGSFTHRTAEFRGQRGDDQFVSISMAFGL
jgi:lipid A 3-O-deacylase